MGRWMNELLGLISTIISLCNKLRVDGRGQRTVLAAKWGNAPP